jgi:hypothetical protein
LTPNSLNEIKFENYHSYDDIASAISYVLNSQSNMTVKKMEDTIVTFIKREIKSIMKMRGSKDIHKLSVVNLYAGKNESDLDYVVYHMYALIESLVNLGDTCILNSTGKNFQYLNIFYGIIEAIPELARIKHLSDLDEKHFYAMEELV